MICCIRFLRQFSKSCVNKVFNIQILHHLVSTTLYPIHNSMSKVDTYFESLITTSIKHAQYLFERFQFLNPSEDWRSSSKQKWIHTYTHYCLNTYTPCPMLANIQSNNNNYHLIQACCWVCVIYIFLQIHFWWFEFNVVLFSFKLANQLGKTYSDNFN